MTLEVRLSPRMCVREGQWKRFAGSVGEERGEESRTHFWKLRAERYSIQIVLITQRIRGAEHAQRVGVEVQEFGYPRSKESSYFIIDWET